MPRSRNAIRIGNIACKLEKVGQFLSIPSWWAQDDKNEICSSGWKESWERAARWMTSAHDVETSVTTSSPFQDSFHPHEQMKETQVEFIDLIKHFLPDWNSSQMAWHTSFKKAFKITSWVHILSTSAFPFEKKPTHNLLLLGVSTKIPPSTDLVFRSKTWSLSLGVNSYKFLHSDA